MMSSKKYRMLTVAALTLLIAGSSGGLISTIGQGMREATVVKADGTTTATLSSTVGPTITSVASAQSTGAGFTQLTKDTSLLSFFGLSASTDVATDGKSLKTGVLAPDGSVINDGSTQATSGVDKGKAAAATLFKALMTQSQVQDGSTLLGSKRSDGTTVTYTNVTLKDMQSLSKFSMADTVKPVATKIAGATKAPFYTITYPDSIGGKPNGNGVAEAINYFGQNFFGSVYSNTAWSSVSPNPKWAGNSWEINASFADIEALAHAASNIKILDLSGLGARYTPYMNSSAFLTLDTSDRSFPNLQVLRLANEYNPSTAASAALGDVLSRGSDSDMFNSKNPMNKLTTLDLSGSGLVDMKSQATIMFTAAPNLQNINFGYNPTISNWPHELDDGAASGQLVKNLASLVTDYTGYQQVPKWAIAASKQGLLVLSMVGNPLVINNDDIALLKHPSTVDYLNLTGNTTGDKDPSNTDGNSTKVMYIDNSTAGAVDVLNNIMSNPVSQMLIANDPTGPLATQVKQLQATVQKNAEQTKQANDYQKLLASAELNGTHSANVNVDVTLTTLNINGKTYTVNVPYTPEDGKLASTLGKTDDQIKADNETLQKKLHDEAVKSLPEQVSAIKEAIASGELTQDTLDKQTVVSDYVAPLTQEQLMQYYDKYPDNVDASGKTFAELAKGISDAIAADPDSATNSVEYQELPSAPQAASSVDSYYEKASATVTTQLTNLSTTTDYTVKQLTAVQDALVKAGADQSQIDAIQKNIDSLNDSKAQIDTILNGATTSGSSSDFFYTRSQSTESTAVISNTTAQAVQNVSDAVADNKDALEQAGFDTSALLTGVMGQAQGLVNSAVNGKTFTKDMADAVVNGGDVTVTVTLKDGSSQTITQHVDKPDSVQDILDNLKALEKATDKDGKAILPSSEVSQLEHDLSNLGQNILNTVTKNQAADLAEDTVKDAIAQSTGKSADDIKVITNADDIAKALTDNNMGKVTADGETDKDATKDMVNNSQAQNGNETAKSPVDDDSDKQSSSSSSETSSDSSSSSDETSSSTSESSSEKTDTPSDKPGEGDDTKPSGTTPGDNPSGDTPADASPSLDVISTMTAGSVAIGSTNMTSGKGAINVKLTDPRQNKDELTVSVRMTKPFTYDDGAKLQDGQLWLGNDNAVGQTIQTSAFENQFTGTTDTQNGFKQQKGLKITCEDATQGVPVGSGKLTSDGTTISYDHAYLYDANVSELAVGTVTATLTWSVSNGPINQ